MFIKNTLTCIRIEAFTLAFFTDLTCFESGHFLRNKSKAIALKNIEFFMVQKYEGFF